MAQACLGLVMLCAASMSDPAAVDDVQLEPDPPAAVETCDLPYCGPLGQRAFCVEGYESQHNGAALNRRSGARGWLQYLPSTARQWGVAIGNRQSEWEGFRRIAAQGERFLTSQWVPIGLGWC